MHSIVIENQRSKRVKDPKLTGIIKCQQSLLKTHTLSYGLLIFEIRPGHANSDVSHCSALNDDTDYL